jgi:hypothetical protein
VIFVWYLHMKTMQANAYQNYITTEFEPCDSLLVNGPTLSLRLYLMYALYFFNGCSGEQICYVSDINLFVVTSEAGTV